MVPFDVASFVQIQPQGGDVVAEEQPIAAFLPANYWLGGVLFDPSRQMDEKE